MRHSRVKSGFQRLTPVCQPAGQTLTHVNVAFLPLSEDELCLVCTFRMKRNLITSPVPLRTSVSTPAALIFLTGLLLAAIPTARAADDALLWQIGQPDKSDREFALAPGGYSKFQQDGFYLVGTSDPAKDWPYVHPGPSDVWGGSRTHTFTISFGLRAAPTEGECRLQVDLVDTHPQGGPEIGIEINSLTFTRRLPNGGSDDSVMGHPEQGRHHAFEIKFPANALLAGANIITITSRSGSWFVYDSVGLRAPAGVTLAPASATLLTSLRGVSALQSSPTGDRQPVKFSIRHQGPAGAGRVLVNGAPVTDVQVRSGETACELAVTAVEKETPLTVSLEMNGQIAASRVLNLKPVRKMTVYILPHSHTDIGYTEIQTEIEDKQVQNLLAGMRHARRTASYPAGARFVWNVEVGWAADLLLRRLGAAERREFLDAVRRGQVGLEGMYLNELTGLCRPEELVQLFRFATILREQTGAPIDSAMISDVPGYTWGTVTAMNQAGIRYFCTAPNYFDRIGDILQKWENKPFWWIGPDGKSKVLVWIPWKGYAMSHVFRALSTEFVEQFATQMEKTSYPYDIAYIRWSGIGDNAVPDPNICEFVKDWNAKYAWPRFIISSTHEAFQAFEKNYGNRLPEARGDWTPYWEDGAGSSALETALNRASSDRLTQAEALWALLNPKARPLSAFADAWRQVLLYSEHTWGAWCSISEPFRRETREQWSIKQGYAVSADILSRDLLSRALSQTIGTTQTNAIDLFNTVSWPRTELVTVQKFLSEGRDRVTDNTGAPIPSQRLRNGELMILAKNVPTLAARRYVLTSGTPHQDGQVKATATTLDNGILFVRVDETTGAIVELKLQGLAVNLADTSGGEALDDYRYFNGDNPADARRNGPVKITIKEPGPLVAVLQIDSEAPGCHRLSREIRLTAGQDFVEVINTLDKARLMSSNYYSNPGKESLNFAFPFNVPDGQVRLEVPYGVMQPDIDQIPSACKNWFTVGRWADVANAEYGVTWITLDAPLVQVGGMTANLLNSQSNPDIWLKKIGRTQKLYSWAMNNHWGTNYRAYQEGPHVFRFVLRPHRGLDLAAASRLAIAATQPLQPTVARGARPPSTPLFTVNTPGVLVTALKPSDDGKALIVRLWGASGANEQAQLAWASPAPKRVWLSDTSERPLRKAGETVTVPAWGLVTLRAELSK